MSRSSMSDRKFKVRTSDQRAAISASQRRRRAQQTAEQRASLNVRRREARAALTTQVRDALNARRRENRANLSVEQRERANCNRRRTPKPTHERAAVADTPNTIDAVLHDLGTMCAECEYCQAMHFSAETGVALHNCCHNGKVKLPTLQPYPPQLLDLLTANNPYSQLFRDNIRVLNNSFALASFGAKLESPPGNGPYVFRIRGQVYHRATTSLAPHENRTPKYGQLYILDEEEAVQYRESGKENALREINLTIERIMRERNPYVGAYKKLADVFREEEERINLEGGQKQSIQLLFQRNATDDQRRYNAPTVSECAAIFVGGDDGAVPTNIDIAVHPKAQHQCQNLNKNSRHIDPMVFVLLFPSGDPGWSIGLLHHQDHRTARNNNLTPLQFYSYRLAVRRHEFSPIHHGGRLFQQYLVHSYIIMESNRLDFIRKNQKQLRVESYQGLADYVSNAAAENNCRAGNIVILPSSFTGSTRNMIQNYQDAMAIVRKYGRPDLFITFTCNPKWPEITSELEPHQTPSDRPDLVARVFRLKLAHLIDLMVKKHIFGVVIAYIYVIEFQKRGLPHCHSLFMLRDEDKFRDADQIDRIISAEIPSQLDDPELYEVVTRHMIHGPCGTLNQNAPCMIDGRCSKYFPKAFNPETDANLNGYPNYRRRDNCSDEIMVRGQATHNGFVVPYNPYLLKTFNAHVNIEHCASIQAIKYLFKYVYKGHDRARVELRTTTSESNSAEMIHDEISSHLDARYVSAPEAAWRLFESPMYEKSHTIVRLAVHIPNGQQIFFEEGQEEEAVARASSSQSTLMAFFSLNAADHTAREILYHNIPQHYVLNLENKWIKRQRGADKVIGRLASVSPRDSERYHIRLILLKVPGLKSFEDMLTVDGVQYGTFRNSAQARGLLINDNEWEKCLKEAAQFMMPSQLRCLFVIILVHCEPSKPLHLWTLFQKDLSEDFLQEYGESAAPLVALSQIELLLNKENMTYSQFGLPKPPPQAAIVTVELTHERQIGEQMFLQFNDQQRAAATKIMNAALNNDKDLQRCFFIDGPGGTGKTFLYSALIHSLRGHNLTVISVAWTGIAAVLLPGGRTCHSMFKLPLRIYSNSTCSLTQKTKDLLSKVKVIIWDEAPMAPSNALGMIDLALRDVADSELPFGGKVMVLGGDFRQVLPVLNMGTRAQIVKQSIKMSPLWNHFEIIHLTTNMRAGADEVQFANWLLELGEGKLPPISAESSLAIALPLSFITDSIVPEIFGQAHAPEDAALISARAILCPKNEDVYKVNEDVLARLHGDLRVYYSVDQVKPQGDEDPNEIQVNYPVEFLNKLNPPGLPPYRLNLKNGAIVMLLRNISMENGLCNGTRLIIREMKDSVIISEIITGLHKGEVHFIPRITLSTENDPNIPFNLCRRQFPVRLAYAMTINKSQGQTFDRVGILLPQPVFSHGQLYVAFSRARSMSSVKVQISETQKQGCRNGVFITENVVYKEIL